MRMIGFSLLLFSSMVLAGTTSNSHLIPASKCQNLTCVRNNIDTIDKQIVKLVGMRLNYAKRAGELKQHTRSVHDQAQENAIIIMVGIEAKQNGYPAAIAQTIFKTILLQANLYERKYHHYQS